MAGGGIRVSAIVLALALGLAVSSAPASAGSGSCYRFNDAEVRLARHTNASRARGGLSALEIDPELSRVAAKHARVMANKARIFHTPDNLLAWRVTNWSLLGENVGRADDTDGLHRAFMNSPTHRSNVLRSDFVHLGVGVARRGGRVWGTVLFESHQDPGTRLVMPSC